MAIVSTIFYFIITIGILVLVHELGHFLAAKFFKMRVDTFSLGFPPRAFGKKIGETDYCISWVPIGGYVKIAGMIDESFDNEFLNKEPQPWEFRSKPIWQRMIVISAGVIMNLLLAILIFWGIIFHQGKTIHPVTEIGYVEPNSPAAKSGLHMGDKFVSINNHPMKQWDEIESTLYTESVAHDLTIQIQRSGTVNTFFIRRSELPDFTEERFGVFPAGFVPVVDLVEHGKPAEQIGLQPGDTLLAVNEKPVSFGSLQEAIRTNAGKEILLSWARGNQKMNAHVKPTAEGRIGVSLDRVYQGPIIHEQYSFFEALPISMRELKTISVLFLSNIYQIVAGKASLSKSMGGPIKIAQLAKRSADTGVLEFFGFISLLSISLALLNILPFPALDGGHLVFLVYEAVFRREVPSKVRIAIQQAGFILLLVFMAFVLYNDVVNF
ncbi:MAG: RIP metalloprotease RseP [Ignavibacteriales bacterium]|nr:RIP metalloprotease RseP [Ignavibacteriales bacterium]